MTPTQTESRMRRSGIVTVQQTPVSNFEVNDDEEERRRARNRETPEDLNTTTASLVENSNTVQNFLKLYAENKLSKNNVWSMSIIDVLNSMLNSHHKSVHNFKVAGSSLEVSSKVYGLRVDSVHVTVMRICSGLHSKKYSEDGAEDDGGGGDEIPAGGEGPPGVVENEQEKAKPKKRQRKHVSTVTKNKETINARLDTNPFTDALFAKLKTIGGSINSSSRLLQNVLASKNGELKSRMDVPFWNKTETEALIHPENEHDYSESLYCELSEMETANLDSLLLRPQHSGYVISNNPVEMEEDSSRNDEEEIGDGELRDATRMEVAFDMDAEIEHPLSQQQQSVFLDVDRESGGFEELTAEEERALQYCKGLKRMPVIIEDMRPIDSTSSRLEYSYRPLDKISQFWAGPSHWKFKRSRGASLFIGQKLPSADEDGSNIRRDTQKRGVGRRARVHNKVLYDEFDDNVFQKINVKKNRRKANVQKKWDAKKLKLPTDMQINKDIFDVFVHAPALSGERISDDNTNSIMSPPPSDIAQDFDHHDFENDELLNNPCENINSDDNIFPPRDENENVNQTVVEIIDEFASAPDKITKIIVPFAKRAKVVDMKQLKRCCFSVLKNQMKETEKENIPMLDELKNDKYKNGYATFSSTYKTLPKILTTNMAEALTPSIALYSILHLANDNNLRLLQQSDLKDFKICQLTDE